MYQIIDGKRISQEIKDELREKAAALKAQGVKRCLAVVQVGSDPASGVYVNNKKKACEYVGIRSLSYQLPEETTQEELLALMRELNGREDVNGILVQLPLPDHIDQDLVLTAIAPEKDVDGFHPVNVGNLSIGRPGYVSCTPAGVIQLLKRSGIEIEGKECVVLGRSNIVGKPMAMLLLRENGTVTVCHSRTKNLKEITRRADIRWWLWENRSLWMGILSKKALWLLMWGSIETRRESSAGMWIFTALRPMFPRSLLFRGVWVP